MYIQSPSSPSVQLRSNIVCKSNSDHEPDSYISPPRLGIIWPSSGPMLYCEVKLTKRITTIDITPEDTKNDVILASPSLIGLFLTTVLRLLRPVDFIGISTDPVVLGSLRVAELSINLLPSELDF